DANDDEKGQEHGEPQGFAGQSSWDAIGPAKVFLEHSMILRPERGCKRIASYFRGPHVRGGGTTVATCVTGRSRARTMAAIPWKNWIMRNALQSFISAVETVINSPKSMRPSKISGMGITPGAAQSAY